MTIATPPEKKTVSRTRTQCVKQAHYKYVDTGAKQLVDIIAKDGTRTTEERAIIDKVFIPALFEDVQENVDVWVVTKQLPDGSTEDHEFSNDADANNYYRGL